MERWRGFEVDVTEVSIDENFVKGRQAEVKHHVAGGGEVKVVLSGRKEGGLGEVGGGEVSPTPRLEVGEERGVGPLVPANTFIYLLIKEEDTLVLSIFVDINFR